MKSLWEEKFNPSPCRAFHIDPIKYVKAWDWIFERDAEGNRIRSQLVRGIIREKALEMRRAGIPGDVTQMCALSVYLAFRHIS